MPVVFFAH